jgi:hypothetical protein
MLHPHTELRFINEQIGYGVIATHFIPRGTVTWVRDDLDQTFSRAQVERMPIASCRENYYPLRALQPAQGEERRSCLCRYILCVHAYLACWRSG